MRKLQRSGMCLYHEDKNIMILCTPKAACTIVTKMFFENKGILQDALKHSGWIHNYREQKYRNKLQLVNNDTKYIQFVVNPYKRIVSSYFWYSDHGPQRMDKKISFANFVKNLHNGTVPLNAHYCSQISTRYGKIEIDYIKMEKINEKLPYIKEKYNLDYKIQTSGHHNSAQGKKIEEYLGDKERNKLPGIPQHYKYFYNDETRKLVEELYQEDIKVFNYTWDDFLNGL
jgi:hypothetical protein